MLRPVSEESPDTSDSAASPDAKAVRASIASARPKLAILDSSISPAGGSFLRKPFAPRVPSEGVERSLAGENHPDGFRGTS